MSSLELSEWIAYDRISPIGREDRADLRNAITCMVIANVNRTRSTPFEISDFMPYSKKPQKMNNPNTAIADYKKQIAEARKGLKNA